MYQVQCTIVGTAPLMQHRFAIPDLENVNPGGTKNTGSKDYSQEWKDYLYTKNGEVCQPASHIERSMIKAATDFKIQGKRGRSYKDLFSAAVFVEPDMISHGIPIPETLDADGDKQIYLDVRPVVIQRNRVIRLRPTLKAGWRLNFNIQVIDDQLPSNILQDVLTLAGRGVGLGDYRPRFGRFSVELFRVIG